MYGEWLLATSPILSCFTNSGREALRRREPPTEETTEPEVPPVRSDRVHHTREGKQVLAQQSKARVAPQKPCAPPNHSSSAVEVGKAGTQPHIPIFLI